MATATASQARQDRSKVASRKALRVVGAPIAVGDSLAGWVDEYRAGAVVGVRSVEVTAKIDKHLARFVEWFVDGFGHDRISAVTGREIEAWRDYLAATVLERTGKPMAPATVNNHLAHLSGFFTWVAARAPDELLPAGDPSAHVAPLRLSAPRPRALTDPQVRTVKNVLDRLETFHRLTGRRHRGAATPPRVHRHARPLRDRAIVHVLRGGGLRREEVTNVDLDQLVPNTPAELRRVRKAQLVDVHGKGRSTRTVFLGRDARHALADYLESERPGDVDEHSEALFLAASSINSRRAGGRLSPRSINNIVAEVGRIHDHEITDPERQLDGLTPHDLRHDYGYRLSANSGHNRAELERRLGHANDRYLRLYTNPPEHVAAGWVEHL